MMERSSLCHFEAHNVIFPVIISWGVRDRAKRTYVDPPLLSEDRVRTKTISKPNRQINYAVRDNRKKEWKHRIEKEIGDRDEWKKWPDNETHK